MLSTNFSHYHFDEAANGKEYEKLIKQNDYELVILDINIPRTNSFQLVKDTLVYLYALAKMYVSGDN
jgi:YesN/AraC family two-component response regulator